MLRTIKIIRSKRLVLSLNFAIIFASVLAIVPVWATAHENTKEVTKAMPVAPMDHSKMSSMDGMKAMNGMKHMEGMSMTGDVDYDFAANMRMHHQMAVDMSQAQLKNGKNPKLRVMATNIIAAQKKEIATLDAWMAAHKKDTMKAKP